MANQYGLIGYPLGHSFSKKYFEEKFRELNSTNNYSLFELEHIDEFKSLFSKQHLKGANITIPHKQSVMPFLDKLDKSAKLVDAVNVIKYTKGEMVGYNTDYPAFKNTLKKWLDNTNLKALVLGTGGSSKAVIAALNDLKIPHKQVSRTKSSNYITYSELNGSNNLIDECKLIINTTPLGMSPHLDSKPNIPYGLLTPSHYLFDLVYNPEETTFMKLGNLAGCHTKNGLEMLHLQADLAWDIWNA